MLRNLHFLGLSTLLAFLGFAGDGEFVPLLDGQILVGEITTHDEEGIEVKRTDTGGLVRLRWAQLAPPYERALRTKLGYAYVDAEEVLVEADEITLNDGSKRIGRIIEQAGDRIVLKDPKSTFGYQRSMLQGAPAKVKVPALDVFTKDELYYERLANVDVSTPQGNLDIARYLEHIQDFGRAIQHLNDLKKIDPTFHANEIGVMLPRLEAKKVRQDEFDYLREIEIERNQHHWNRAISLCDGFAGKFPKSLPETRADVDKRKKNVLELKQKDMTKRAFDEYYRATERVAHNKAYDRKVGLQEARGYADAEMSRVILETATKAAQRDFPELNEQVVEKLWKDRGKLPKVRHVSYGMGTFILGSGARAGLDPSGRGTKTAGPSAEEQEMAKKLKKMLERSTGQAAGQGQQQKLSPEDEWWQLRAAPFERYQFLLAYFVEQHKGKIFEIVDLGSRQCQGCGGLGQIQVLSTGGSTPGGVSAGGNRGGQPQQTNGTTNAPCPTCHGVGIERIVYYR